MGISTTLGLPEAPPRPSRPAGRRRAPSVGPPAAVPTPTDGPANAPARARPAVRRRRAAHASPWPRRAAVGAAVVGAAIRLEQYEWRRSLWLDEALIADNIVGRSFGGLLHPLSGGQGAPVGWLWAERAAAIVLGDNEYALRLIPLMAGLLALPLIYLVARPMIGRWGAALATALLALSPAALRYSVEVKQYSSDLAIALALTVLAGRAVRGRRRVDRGRALALWGLAGAVAVWCSHPAVLVLAGQATVLAADAARRRRRPDLWTTVAWSAPWLASFAADWVVSLRRLGEDSFLHHYWASGFGPDPFARVGFGPLVSWLVHAPVRLMSDPAAMPVAGVAALIALVGLAWIVHRRPAEGALLGLPLLVGLGAAAVGAYPLEGRMALWLLPLALILLAAAVPALAATLRWASDRALHLHRAAHRARGSTRWVSAMAATACLAAVVQGPVRQVSSVAHDPATWVDLRPLLQAVASRSAPRDGVWVHSDDAAAAAYYARSTGSIPTAVVWDGPSLQNCPGQSDLALAAAGQRVWFVFGYLSSASVPDAAAAINARLASVAHLVAEIHRPQATAWLWDFGAPADSAHLDRPAQDVACVSVTPAPAPAPTGLTTGPLGRGRRV
ncbi:MAG TPA: glycosyltransferase family 39 protein [Acidimicrobiales bacterium]